MSTDLIVFSFFSARVTFFCLQRLQSSVLDHRCRVHLRTMAVTKRTKKFAHKKLDSAIEARKKLQKNKRIAQKRSEKKASRKSAPHASSNDLDGASGDDDGDDDTAAAPVQEQNNKFAGMTVDDFLNQDMGSESESDEDDEEDDGDMEALEDASGMYPSILAQIIANQTH